MKERMITLGLALGAFVLFYALFVPKPGALADKSAMPLSTENMDSGYQGAWRWMQAQQIPVVSLRNRYGHIAQQGVPGTGNLLITTVPQKVPAREDETRNLHQWLERGNTLLVMAALDDTPAWSLRAGDPNELLKRMTGLKFEVVPEKAPQDDRDSTSRSQTLRQAVQQVLAAQRGSIVAKGAHPLFAGVASVTTQSEYPASRWVAHTTDASAVLELGVRSDMAKGSSTPEPAVWLRRYGIGQIIVVGYASPFSNALIGDAGNATLFANIVAWSRAAQGAVLFDDAHQGLVSYYDARTFFGDPRLHRTLLWVCLLWLLFVLGWQRLRPRSEGWNPVDVTTFIKVIGGFIAGRVPESIAGQRLCANFFNRIRLRLALPQNGLPVWDWLATQAVVPAADLEQLRRLYGRALSRQKVDLVQLQNCLTKMMGNLT
ncbi:MAG: DUF4350 domain-containing protein [Pseudomonadota bacterium]